MKMKKNICDVCGREYEAAGPNRSYCDGCFPAARRARFRALRLFGCASDADERHRFIVEEARNILANENDPVRLGRKPGEDVRCHYCGKMTRSATGYCRSCRNSGYSGIHQITGKTNGWDKAPTERVHVEGGWRGQRLIGGYASSASLKM